MCVSWGLYHGKGQVWPVKELTQLWYHPHPQPNLFTFGFTDCQNVLVRRIRCPSMAAPWFKWQTPQTGAFHRSDLDQECSKTTSAAEMTILHCFNPKNRAEDVQEESLCTWKCPEKFIYNLFGPPYFGFCKEYLCMSDGMRIYLKAN